MVQAWHSQDCASSLSSSPFLISDIFCFIGDRDRDLDGVLFPKGDSIPNNISKI